MRLIDGEALLNQIDEKLKSMRNVASYSYSSGIYHVYKSLYNEIKNGLFDITDDTGIKNVQEVELHLLQMWQAAGIEFIYKYKHRVKSFREPLANYELFCDVTCGTWFCDVPDVANSRDAIPEECKISVESLIARRVGVTIPGITDEQ